MMSRIRLLVLCVVLGFVPLAADGLESRTPYHSASDAVARPDSEVLLAAWFHHSAGVRKAWNMPRCAPNDWWTAAGYL